VKAFEFRPSSLILVPLICDLKNHDIVGSALPVEKFLIIDLIEQGRLFVVSLVGGFFYKNNIVKKFISQKLYPV
jgi:hypothetical protein